MKHRYEQTGPVRLRRGSVDIASFRYVHDVEVLNLVVSIECEPIHSRGCYQLNCRSLLIYYFVLLGVRDSEFILDFRIKHSL
jgi:hypothetical protein